MEQRTMAATVAQIANVAIAASAANDGSDLITTGPKIEHQTCGL